MMKVHRFECNKTHVFFIPLDLPRDATVVAIELGKMKCPLCNCSSKEIKMTPNEFTVN